MMTMRLLRRVEEVGTRLEGRRRQGLVRPQQLWHLDADHGRLPSE